MKRAIELIYDPDCPNVAQTRAALRDACAQLGMAPEWLEWNRRDAASPQYTQGFGSPTVLVDGRDVAGVAAGAMPSCCRVYQSGGGLIGAPPAGEIVAALQGQSGQPADGNRRPPLSGLGASFALAGLCPVCWTAYAALFGSLGVGFILNPAFLLPVTLLLLAVALFALGFKAADRRGHGPLGIGIAAALLILFARFILVSDPLTFLGLAALVGASVWNVRPITSTAKPRRACVTGNDTHKPKEMIP